MGAAVLGLNFRVSSCWGSPGRGLGVLGFRVLGGSPGFRFSVLGFPRFWVLRDGDPQDLGF